MLPWHDPVLLAEQAATLDLLSRGRLDFGIGKGYRDVEFESFRIPKEEALERYEESLGLILKSWTSDERFSHDGKFWKYSDIVVEPPVLQKPHPPLWTGAGTDESIARVAKSGLNVLFDQFATFGRTEERLRVWRAACAQAGRVFDPMHVGLARAVVIAGDEREYEAAVRAREKRVAQMVGAYGALPGLDGKQPETYADRDRASDALIGDPDAVLRRLRDLREMGFEYVLMLLPGQSRDAAPVRARDNARIAGWRAPRRVIAPGIGHIQTGTSPAMPMRRISRVWSPGKSRRACWAQRLSQITRSPLRQTCS